MPKEQIVKNFTYHPPQPGQPEKYTAIREKALELALLLDEQCPDSREKSLAITKLEETVMWANASIARAGETSTRPLLKPGDTVAYFDESGQGFEATVTNVITQDLVDLMYIGKGGKEMHPTTVPLRRTAMTGNFFMIGKFKGLYSEERTTCM